MPTPLNRSGQPIKRDQVAPLRRVDVDGIEDALNSQQLQINQKANASTVGGLTTAVNSKASQSSVDALVGAVAGKADASALAAKANASDLPLPADTAPKAEATSAAKGSEIKKFALEDHQHPRLTSTTAGTLGSAGAATVTFTRSFVNPPGMVITEIPGTAPPQTMPAEFKVESWIREVMTPTPSGAYTGCVIRGWRSQVLPTMTTLNLATLLTGVITGLNTVISALTGFNVFAASANGTAFTCIAIQRSDVT